MSTRYLVDTCAFLAAGGAEENVAVAFFDHDLDKFQDLKRFEPTA